MTCSNNCKCNPFPKKGHPFGPTQPVPVVDHVLGEAYYVVKSVYANLGIIQEILNNMDSIQETTEEALASIKSSLATAIEELKSSLGTIAGYSCNFSTMTLDGALEAGASVEIPGAFIYIVGRHHLRVSWNGLDLIKNVHFEEVGDADASSQQIKILIPMEEGDELNFWVGSLGIGDFTAMMTTAENALALAQELSEASAVAVHYKGAVASYENLPTEGMSVGDMYNITTASTVYNIRAGDNVFWTGSAWDKYAGEYGDLSALLSDLTDAEVDSCV